MRKVLAALMPDNDVQRKWVAVVFTMLVASVFTYIGIKAIGEYGLALFILTPLLIGANPAMLYGLKKPITKKQAFSLGLLTLGIFTAGLILMALEGLICIAMAAPLAFVLTWLGSLIGYTVVSRTPNDIPTAMLIIIASVPAVSFAEDDGEPALTPLTTSIEIRADAATVWKNVIEFPELEKPGEFIFKTGIAYPVNAKIVGKGVGAIRHCNFTTGSFVEPITIWDEPKLLAFEVAEQPAPMKEISFWDVHAPHLHDYFVSKRGQFRITTLPNGNTLLEGTTWYYNRIRPDFYWKLWSNYIVHQIHHRVLTHIKKNAEQKPLALGPGQ